KLKGYAARNAENKRRFNNDPRDNHVQQPPFKSQNVGEKNVARAYTVGNSENKRVAVATTAQRALVANQKFVTCFRRAYALGGGDGNPDSNVVTGTFLINNRYAYILFDSGADRSFVSIMFSALIDITPSALDVSYTVELADVRIAGSDTIIGVLSRYHAMIVCVEKIVCISYDNEILTIQGDISNAKKMEDKSEEEQLEDVLIV
ncbi:hypothetical protein Tco_0035227, partial [Tanacetum coccineum]